MDPGSERRKSLPSIRGPSTEPNPLWKDSGNVALLVILYLLQGVPLGLTFGAIPFLLKSRLSYSEIALISLSQYPYSLKLLWSPIVDTYFFKAIGRRKSWIVPIQAITGIMLFVLGSRIDTIFKEETLPVTYLAVLLTALVFFCATQDIAVDGWALTLLRDENKHFASTAQTIGLNTGYFLSFTIFLALNSPEFCNKFLRSIPMEEGLVPLGTYMQFWGAMFLLCNAWLIFVKTETEDLTEEVEDVQTVYRNIASVCRMSHMKRFIFVLLIAKIGFIANESVTPLKLLDKGLKKEDMAVSVLIDFPFQIVFGYYAAKWSSGKNPLQPWLYAFYGRLLFAVVGMLLVSWFPSEGVTTGYFVGVMVATVLNSFMSTVQFVGMGSFFTRISDPVIGGTYMTLLNTLSNLGGTWPRFFVLEAVDYFTDSYCDTTGNGTITKNPSTTRIPCITDPQKTHCIDDLGGQCIVARDGFYFVGIISVVLGLFTCLFIIRPQVLWLQDLPDKAWRLQKTKKARSGTSDHAESENLLGAESREGTGVERDEFESVVNDGATPLKRRGGGNR
ncbi:acetyl-coenzyme A transporter 1 [Phlyctochytrium arcticum]|nr:acetyl-coenzyme A transporter 1 [Phlyctochytrium arcticum]